MKKKVIIISSLIIVLLVIGIIYFTNKKTTDIYVCEKYESNVLLNYNDITCDITSSFEFIVNPKKNNEIIQNTNMVSVYLKNEKDFNDYYELTQKDFETSPIYQDASLIKDDANKAVIVSANHQFKDYTKYSKELEEDIAKFGFTCRKI